MQPEAMIQATQGRMPGLEWWQLAAIRLRPMRRGCDGQAKIHFIDGQANSNNIEVLGGQGALGRSRTAARTATQAAREAAVANSVLCRIAVGPCGGSRMVRARTAVDRPAVAGVLLVRSVRGRGRWDGPGFRRIAWDLGRNQGRSRRRRDGVMHRCFDREARLAPRKRRVAPPPRTGPSHGRRAS